MADVSFDNAFALLVGVGGLDFDVTVKDAKDLYNILTDPSRAGYPPDNVRLLTEETATRNNFFQALDDLIAKTNNASNATVFLYYSGHGGQYKSQSVNDADGVEYFLKTWGYNENDPENTMLNGKIFSEKIAGIKTDRLIILLDCCHAAGMKESGVITKKGADSISGKMMLSGAKLIEQLNGGKGRVFISACADNESSVILPNAENSLFTQVTLEALDGAASGEDALVRVIDLMYHVLREVPARLRKYNHPQNPVINEVKDLNPAYYLCHNGKSIPERQPGQQMNKNARDVGYEGVKSNYKEPREKMEFISEYKNVVTVKFETTYNQNVHNYQAPNKQIIMGNNTGQINME